MNEIKAELKIDYLVSTLQSLLELRKFKQKNLKVGIDHKLIEGIETTTWEEAERAVRMFKGGKNLEGEVFQLVIFGETLEVVLTDFIRGVEGNENGLVDDSFPSESTSVEWEFLEGTNPLLINLITRNKDIMVEISVQIINQIESKIEENKLALC